MEGNGELKCGILVRATENLCGAGDKQLTKEIQIKGGIASVTMPVCQAHQDMLRRTRPHWSLTEQRTLK